MSNYNKKQVLGFMADLLHPTKIIDKSYFPKTQVFWDLLVKFGSEHLVLPSIYASIKRKKLLNYVPKDLMIYLGEISDLNHERNITILRQAIFLSKAFKMNQIGHVFLKGVAILISKPYDAVNERMIGDIDILVKKKDLLKAQQLLLDEGFRPVSSEFKFTEDLSPDYTDRHLDRLYHPDYISAVEIHRFLVKDKKNINWSDSVLDSKVCYDNIFIPSNNNLWRHAILNWQYNDGGMIKSSLSFRTIVDVLYLESKEDVKNLKNQENAIKHYYSLLSLFYETYTTYYPWVKITYNWQLKLRFFHDLYQFIIKLYSFINLSIKRFALLLSSKKYRIKVLKNPKLMLSLILKLIKK